MAAFEIIKLPGNMTNTIHRLSPSEMKEVKGGVLPPPKTKWSCLVDGYYYDVCYSVQPQVPCGYATACTDIGDCTSPMDLCVV